MMLFVALPRKSAAEVFSTIISTAVYYMATSATSFHTFK